MKGSAARIIPPQARGSDHHAHDNALALGAGSGAANDRARSAAPSTTGDRQNEMTICSSSKDRYPRSPSSLLGRKFTRASLPIR